MEGTRPADSPGSVCGAGGPGPAPSSKIVWGPAAQDNCSQGHGIKRSLHAVSLPPGVIPHTPVAPPR